MQHYGSATTEPNQAPESLWLLRKPTPQDLVFLQRVWLRLYRTSGFAVAIPTKTYEQMHGEAIRRILARGAEVGVAYDAEAPDLLLGFAVTEHGGQLLHYVWVRPDTIQVGNKYEPIWRHRGICRKLIGLLPVKHYTHKDKGTKWVLKLHSGATYHPYLL